MTTLREAAQQALEALEGKRYTACGWRSDCDKAITALRAALAEPENWELRRLHAELERCKKTCAATAEAWREEAALAEPAQEPVAWMDIDSDGNRLSVRQWSDGNRDEVPLYTSPPRRKPLTDDQLDDIAVAARRGNLYDLRIAIERALKIGGTE